MVLFTQYFMKRKGMGRICQKFQYRLDLKSSEELDKKDSQYTCPQPLQYLLRVISNTHIDKSVCSVTL